MTKLLIDWCSPTAASHAVKNWHYTHTLPAGPRVRVGVWEDGVFCGCLIFSNGANKCIGTMFGLTQREACELTRVALRDHKTSVSRILSIAIKFLRKQSPGLRMVVSYADSDQGHHGGIYQAAGWIYVGESHASALIVHGVRVHPRTIGARYGKVSLPWLQANVDPCAHRVNTGAKYKYVLVLDPTLRPVFDKLRKPYPKRAESAAGGTSGIQPEGGGSIPTSALFKSRRLNSKFVQGRKRDKPDKGNS